MQINSNSAMYENESSSVETMANYVIARPADISTLRTKTTPGIADVKQTMGERRKRFSKSPKKQKNVEIKTFNISSIVKIVLFLVATIVFTTGIIGYGIHHSISENSKEFARNERSQFLLRAEIRNLTADSEALQRNVQNMILEIQELNNAVASVHERADKHRAEILYKLDAMKASHKGSRDELENQECYIRTLRKLSAKETSSD